MTHAVTWSHGRPHRYYVCLNAQKRGWDSCPTKSVRADDIEASVIDRLRHLRLNGEPASPSAGDRSMHVELPAVDEAPEAPDPFGTVWDALKPRDRRRALALVLEQVAYDGTTGSLVASVCPSGIEALCRSVGLPRTEETS